MVPESLTCCNIQVSNYSITRDDDEDIGEKSKNETDFKN